MAEKARWLGATLGSWRIKALVGEGAFGSVYEAEHVAQAGTVGALKVLHAHYAADDTIKRRFLNEATAASRAQHQNIVQILDSGITLDGVCFEVMELLIGRTLGEALRDAGRLDIPRAINIGVQVASALGSAHSVQVTHRDLKPENIFLIARGENHDFVKVLDFGVAKLRGESQTQELTATGSIIGTNAYMSPEQWMSRPDVDGRADIYALGIILYECLAGAQPFRATTVVDWVRIHLEENAPDLHSVASVPIELSRVIHKMLAKKPEERQQTMYAVMRDLQQALAIEREQATKKAVQLPRAGMKSPPIAVAQSTMLLTPTPRPDVRSEETRLLTPVAPATQILAPPPLDARRGPPSQPTSIINPQRPLTRTPQPAQETQLLSPIAADWARPPSQPTAIISAQSPRPSPIAQETQLLSPIAERARPPSQRTAIINPVQKPPANQETQLLVPLPDRGAVRPVAPHPVSAAKKSVARPSDWDASGVVPTVVRTRAPRTTSRKSGMSTPARLALSLLALAALLIVIVEWDVVRSLFR